jgi:hypothetical protein
MCRKERKKGRKEGRQYLLSQARLSLLEGPNNVHTCKNSCSPPRAKNMDITWGGGRRGAIDFSPKFSTLDF